LQAPERTDAAAVRRLPDGPGRRRGPAGGRGPRSGPAGCLSGDGYDNGPFRTHAPPQARKASLTGPAPAFGHSRPALLFTPKVLCFTALTPSFILLSPVAVKLGRPGRR